MTHFSILESRKSSNHTYNSFQLVEQNEKLEARFKTLDNSSGDGIGDVGNNQSDGVPGLTDKELLRLLEAEKKNSSRLNNENSELKEKLKRSTLSKR